MLKKINSPQKTLGRMNVNNVNTVNSDGNDGCQLHTSHENKIIQVF